MNQMPAIIAFVLAGVLLPLAMQCRRLWPKLSGPVFVVWLALPIGTAYLANAWETSRDPILETSVQDRPREIPRDGYVQSVNCRACHPEQYASWHDSFHRTMTQLANPVSVLGDFDDTDLQIGGRNYQLSRDGEKYFVDITEQVSSGTDETPRSHRGEIVMTTGSHHMQAYWYTSGQGRITVQLPFVWLVPEQSWLAESHSFLKPDERHGNDKMSNWNTTCINCHTTHGCQGGVQVTDKIDTQAAEFGIACESCHGPAEEHVAVNRDPLHRYQNHFSDKQDPTIKNPANMDHQQASEVCGSCHAGARLFASADIAREAKTSGRIYRPGGQLSDERLILQPRDGKTLQNPLVRSVLRSQPQLLQGRFWSDGLARVSGTEYNAMVDSPCYQEGEMSCMSCHAMHQSNSGSRPAHDWTDDQLKVGMRGNEACTQCHADLESPAALSEHSHHEASSSGSLCYNCHMPYTTFGLLKAIRSHTVTSPSSLESLMIGRPNACNQCHLDKPLSWTAEQLGAWFDIESPSIPSEQKDVAAAVQWTLSGDAGQRALMAWNLGWSSAHEVSGNDWQAPYLANLLVDPYPAVRVVANRALKRLPPFVDFEYNLMGSATDREDARRRALAIWEANQADREGTARPHVLIRQDGTIDQTRFDRLSAKRNNRFISLEE